MLCLFFNILTCKSWNIFELSPPIDNLLLLKHNLILNLFLPIKVYYKRLLSLLSLLLLIIVDHNLCTLIALLLPTFANTDALRLLATALFFPAVVRAVILLRL